MRTSCSPSEAAARDLVARRSTCRLSCLLTSAYSRRRKRVFGAPKAYISVPWREVSRVNGEPWNGDMMRIAVRFETSRGELEIIDSPMSAYEMETRSRNHVPVQGIAAWRPLLRDGSSMPPLNLIGTRTEENPFIAHGRRRPRLRTEPAPRPLRDHHRRPGPRSNPHRVR